MHIPKTQSALRERIEVLAKRIQRLNDMAAFRADRFDPARVSSALMRCSLELSSVSMKLYLLLAVGRYRTSRFPSGGVISGLPHPPFSSTGQPDAGPGESVIRREGRFVSGLIPGANQGSKIDIPPKTFDELTEAMKRSANADRRFLKDGESEI